ncbi:MAG: hypothetical protein IJG13_00630 [Kiritimatiellae bacterium]|nr:hypothetical protein [Kiritimatiellia bacterium]
MKKTIVGIASILAMCVNAFASPASLSAKAAIKGGENLAAKIGLRTAGEAAVRGGTKLAAVTTEREAAKRTAGGIAEGVAKKVTAKQLLAAGVGTAAVVAAHETADGVQQMGEGVKEAVREKPELAERIAETVTSPIRWLVGMATAGAMAFLVWFIWPWASLVRNWSKLVAARRTATMRSSEPVADGAADVIDVAPSAPASAHPGFTRVELIVMLAGFLLLSVVGVWRIVKSGTPDGDQSPTGHDAAASQKARVAERAKKVAQLRANYIAALDRHYATFVSDVESEAFARFGEVRDGIPSVASKFGAFSRCKDLLVTLVKDKISKGNRTEQSIKRDLEADFYRGLYDARDKVNAHLVIFLRNAEAERKSFQRELEVELDSIELPGDEAFKGLLTDGGDRIEKSKRKLLEGQIAAAISVVFEAACIRFTVNHISRILGRAAARIAGSAAVGAGAALVDGPLPILDFVGGAVVVGTTAWSIRDIYKATKTLPAELTKTLRFVVDDCEAQTVGEIKKTGRAIYEEYGGRCGKEV